MVRGGDGGGFRLACLPRWAFVRLAALLLKFLVRLTGTLIGLGMQANPPN